jgi:hypothetical protein
MRVCASCGLLYAQNHPRKHCVICEEIIEQYVDEDE